MQAGKSLQARRTQAPVPLAGDQAGFTYLALLVMLLFIGLASQGVMQVVSQQAQREREDSLLRIGQAYARAIGAYYEATPGTLKRWPRDLDDLLEDRRLVSVRRHLRERYPDPITRLNDWELIRAADGGIQGISSRSEQVPLRHGSVLLDGPEGWELPAVRQYREWQFVYIPRLAPNPPPPGKSR
jgi:type II secretory pathway pseudopilin PulG